MTDQFPELTEEQRTAKEMPTQKLPEGYVWTRTIFGRWASIREEDKGSPHMDPSYETYWTM
ncbi:MAG: hypothetical protein VW683_10325 [Betaproteobacteria bacterium]|jgi:hypothetical protein